MPEFSAAWTKEDGIEFPVLTDLGNGVARTFHLTFRLPERLEALYRDHLKIDLARFNGDASWELAVPASFVLDSSGLIRYASASADYTRRPEPTELLDAVRAL